MSEFKVIYEEFKVQGKDLVEKLKGLVREGNIRRIIIKDKGGDTFLEIPLTVAAVGVIAMPVLAAIGAIAGAVCVLAKRQLTDITSGLICLSAIFLLLRFKKINEPVIILIAAVVGFLIKTF